MRLFKSVGNVIPGAIGVGFGAVMLMARDIMAAGSSNHTVGEELDGDAPSMAPWQAWMMCGVVTIAVVCVYRYRAAALVQQGEVDDLDLRRTFVV
jgi:hypothetical protein